MDNLIKKISEYLQENPNSNARSICKEVGADKSVVNSCLYSNEGIRFLKVGLTPPMWRNINDSAGAESEETEVADFADFDGSEADENFDIETEYGEQSIGGGEDWTRLDAIDQKDYLAIKARTNLGEKISKEDRSRMNQLKNRIHQSVRNEIAFIESGERKLQNRAEYVAIIDEEVKKMWSVEEQRAQAISALSLQFESNLRRLAYGFLVSSREEHVEQENESEIEKRSFNAHKLITSVSSTINTRLSNLENMLDEDLVRSTVRFGWMNRNQPSRPNSASSTEMVPQFEEIEEVKIYRSRFQIIVQRINEA
jgi:hypothetical protein